MTKIKTREELEYVIRDRVIKLFSDKIFISAKNDTSWADADPVKFGIVKDKFLLLCSV